MWSFKKEYLELPKEKQDQIQEAWNLHNKMSKFLSDTDYIIIKIAEAEALGDHDEAERIRTEHADTIARRAELRTAINAIEDKWEK